MSSKGREDRYSLKDLSKKWGEGINDLLDRAANNALPLAYSGVEYRDIAYHEYEDEIEEKRFVGIRMEPLDGWEIPAESIKEMGKVKPWLIRTIGDQQGFLTSIADGHPCLEVDELSLFFVGLDYKLKRLLKEEHASTTKARTRNEELLNSVKKLIKLHGNEMVFDNSAAAPDGHWKLNPGAVADRMIKDYEKKHGRGVKTPNNKATLTAKINRWLNEKEIPHYLPQKAD